jgi:NAD(P)-dependent dehydrogenase (short-subunit alcohol dehydrogenase family)
MPARVGVDSYSYHRLLGEVRRGETPALHIFPRGSLDVVAEARRLELDFARSESILARLPAGRWGEPADLAGAAVFLASAASDYVHGIVLPVDGGWLGR